VRKMITLAATFTTALALFAATPASAQRDQRDPRYRSETRDNRVSVQGHIRTFRAERDGYRVYLDRGNDSFWIPRSMLGRRQLRVGLDIRLGGVFRGGYVWVDALGWPGDAYYRDGESNRYDYGYGRDLVSGRVERVDYRAERLVLRDDRSGRVIEIDTRAADDRHRRLDISDVHRGDRITLRGTWEHGVFRAFRIESIRAH
jgi:hypothetical protein